MTQGPAALPADSTADHDTLRAAEQYANALPQELLEPIATRFRVLGDTTRLSIIRTLLGLDGDGPGEMNVGELVDELGSSQANISKHLKILQDAGIVQRRPEGTAAYFSVTDPSLVSLCSIVCDRLRQQVREDARTYAV